MIPRPHNPRINDPIRVFGINFYDLAIVGAVLLILMLVLGGVNVFTDIVGPFTGLFLILLFLGAFFGLKYANKQNHPSFLKSFLSYHLYQPKRITFYHPKPGKKTL